MDLLKISDKKVIPSAYTLTIKDFKNLKSEDLAAIYYFTDHRSPYAVYPLEDRKVKIVHDLGIKWSSKPDVGVKKYTVQYTITCISLLRSNQSFNA